jgi:hypothetical protein
MIHLSVLTFLLTVGLNSVSLAAAIAPPSSDISSPDGVYSLRISNTAVPGSDPYKGFYALELSRRGNVLSKHATEGYLLEAFWSKDGKFVAVNNRRGSSGDYLWIFRLSDGKALKEPNDNETPFFITQVQANSLISQMKHLIGDTRWRAAGRHPNICGSEPAFSFLISMAPRFMLINFATSKKKQSLLSER